MGYHVVNVLLHLLVTVAFFRLCRTIVPITAKTSFVAALLFAVHPVHTEAVTGVVGRAELLSSLFYIGALMTYAGATGKRREDIAWLSLIQSLAMVAVAMLCKEQGITVIGVCCVYEIFVAQRVTLHDALDIVRRGVFPQWLHRSVLRTGFIVGLSGFLMFARMKVMGGQLPVFTRFDNPAAVADTPWSQLTFNYMLPLNAWLLLNPSWLCCDWTMGTIPLIESLSDVRIGVVVVFYACLIVLSVYALTQRSRCQRAIVMCLALVAFPFVPASNLFFPVGFVVAERVLYAPSMGFCLLVAVGFEHLMSHAVRVGKILGWLALVILVLTHSTKTLMRNYDWTSEYR